MERNVQLVVDSDFYFSNRILAPLAEYLQSLADPSSFSFPSKASKEFQGSVDSVLPSFADSRCLHQRRRVAEGQEHQEEVQGDSLEAALELFRLGVYKLMEELAESLEGCLIRRESFIVPKL